MDILDRVISDKRFRIFKTILEMGVSKQRVIMILKQRFNELSCNNSNMFLFDHYGKPLIMFFKYNNKTYSRFFRVGKQVTEDINEISKNGKWYYVSSFAGNVRYTPQSAATVEHTITPENYYSGDFEAGVYDGIYSYIKDEEYILTSVVSTYNIGYKLGFRVASKIETSVDGKLVKGIADGYKAVITGEEYDLSSVVSKYNIGFKLGYNYGSNNVLSTGSTTNTDEYNQGFDDGFTDKSNGKSKDDYVKGYNDGYEMEPYKSGTDDYNYGYDEGFNDQEVDNEKNDYVKGYNDGYKMAVDLTDDPWRKSETSTLSSSSTDTEQGLQDGFEDGYEGNGKDDLTGKSEEYVNAYKEGYGMGKDLKDAEDPWRESEESIESKDYQQGYRDGYKDGLKGEKKAKLTNNKSDYIIGYNDGYSDGSADSRIYWDNYELGYLDGSSGKEYSEKYSETRGYSQGYYHGKSGKTNKYSADKSTVSTAY